ncbi:MAG: TIGR04211 family SH3 domain-containing protein [Candidatus Polarisedimenticolaceae bacterium]|nr:TIGR04211 family SH3 domain-containing protein [Candidatus Polarisedimenticolaceae bacterium]
MSRTTLICYLLLTALFNSVSAETFYVTDKLRLGLYEEASSGGKQLRLLSSGDQLILLNRTKYYAQVETEDGVIGWTKLGFLVDEVPPSFRAARLEIEVESLNQRVESAEQSQLLSQQQLIDTEQQLTTSKSALEQNRKNIAALEVKQATLSTALTAAQEMNQNSVPFNWLLYAAAAAIIFGFLAGLWCLDAISRHRHGGYRVY